ncbi:MAG TPA: glutathione S-transferase family protein [Hyphomicrobium sp.]|nr:glutathione S-transferase family protein [Hyphomicrobium sp.]
MYTLIGSLKTRAFRVAWMLNELGQPFEHDPSPPRNPKLAELNPSLKVPILKDGDDAIIDSVAICQYLADKHKQLTFPAGTIARGKQDSFTQFSVDDVELPLWVAAKHKFALPQDLRVPDVNRACEYDFDRAMTTLSTRLATRPFVMGETFTVPDLLLGHCTMWARANDWKIPDGNVADYVARIHARPAFLKTIETRKAA